MTTSFDWLQACSYAAEAWWTRACGPAAVSAAEIHGTYVPVRAEVACIGNLSAHADAPEIVAWLRTFRRAPSTTHLTYGEPDASDALRKRIGDSLGWNCIVPGYLERVQA